MSSPATWADVLVALAAIASVVVAVVAPAESRRSGRVASVQAYPACSRRPA